MIKRAIFLSIIICIRSTYTANYRPEWEAVPNCNTTAELNQLEGALFTHTIPERTTTYYFSICGLQKNGTIHNISLGKTEHEGAELQLIGYYDASDPSVVENFPVLTFLSKHPIDSLSPTFHVHMIILLCGARNLTLQEDQRGSTQVFLLYHPGFCPSPVKWIILGCAISLFLIPLLVGVVYTVLFYRPLGSRNRRCCFKAKNRLVPLFWRHHAQNVTYYRIPTDENDPPKMEGVLVTESDTEDDVLLNLA